MKQILLLLAILTAISLQAQDSAKISFKDKLSNQLDRLSIHMNMATPSFSFSEIGRLNTKKLGQVNIGEVNIAYKLSPRLSIGLSSMSNLASSQAGYFNQEGQFFSFCDDDDEDHDAPDEALNDADDDHNELEDDDCDDDDLDALLGSLTFKLSERLPFFVQAASGYSFAGKSVAYSTMIGYNQKILGGLGVMAGVRYSDVLYKKPIEAVRTTATSGMRLDLGLSWNF